MPGRPGEFQPEPAVNGEVNFPISGGVIFPTLRLSGDQPGLNQACTFLGLPGQIRLAVHRNLKYDARLSFAKNVSTNINVVYNKR